MTVGIVNWSNGIFPLQDHDFQNHAEASEAVSRRQAIAGARISRLEDPGSGKDPRDVIPEIGREEGMGTVGDVHPWIFIQTEDRAKRGMGSWSQAFAAMTTAGGTGGSAGGYSRPIVPIEAHPIRDKESHEDKRYHESLPGWPRCFPSLPQGVHVLLMAGTEETKQETVAIHADPRLFAVHTEGPGEAGSLVCDLQPEAEPCMNGSTVPGQGGRHARLQSFVKVIPIARARPLPNLDAKAGNAIAWNLSTGGVDEIAGFGMVWGRLLAGAYVPPGPITPSGRTVNGRREGAPGMAGSPGPRAESVGTPGTGSEDEPRTPEDFGEFTAKHRENHGVALAAHVPAFGPFHLGATSDQHRIGVDDDGHPINSLHIATGAYFFRNQREDGPLLFEQDYRRPALFSPLRSPVHLEWDQEPSHPKVGGSGKGIWRWTAEVPFLSPPTTGRPPYDPTPPRTPGGPATPGGPGTPGGGPPTPGGPVTPGGPGGGTGAPNRPLTPVYEIGPRNPPGPFNSPESGGFNGPQGPSTPGSAPTTPGGVPYDPEIDEWVKRRRQREKPSRPGRPLRNVGETSPDDRSLYSIMHPFHTSFAEMAWRPQVWANGKPSIAHNPTLTPDDYEDHESEAPQVVSLKSWAAQNDDCTFAYTKHPDDSRARGGTANGGILFAPPHLEMEDYLGINSSVSVTDTETTSYVTVAPNVALALGTPSTDGDLENKSIRIRQNPNATDRGLLIEQKYDGSWVEVFAGRVQSSSGEVIAELAQGGNQAVRLPRGGDADRPSLANLAGMLRINSETSGFDYLEFYDEQSAAWIQLGGASVPTSGLGLDEVMAAQYFGGAF